MRILSLLLASVLACGAVWAEDTPRGPVTNLPLPRYVSLKASEANVRRGPGLTHRIDWVFQHRNMPVQITAEYGHWRRVKDIEGAGGWVHYSLLSGSRYVIVTGESAALHKTPESRARLVAHIEPGALAQLGKCGLEWCRVSAQGLRGWLPKSTMWGVDEDELRD
ncbi:MAG: SH3 domain-containing protein [Pseudomonadota bacterium]